MRVLVTGANSFLGRHVAAHLVEAGYQVTGTYRRPGPTVDCLTAALRGGSFKPVQLDLADPLAFDSLEMQEAIVHVAGVSTAEGVTIDEMLACNVLGMRNLLRFALDRGAAKLIHASTLSVYGSTSETCIDEHTGIVDPDPYGASKLLGERLMADVADRLPSVAVRLPGVLGLGAHRAWIPVMLEKARRGEDIVIFNPDAPFNNAAHVGDLSRFFEGLLHRSWDGFAAFPVAARETIPIREVAERVSQGSGSAARILVKAGAKPSFTISSSFAIKRFGYGPMAVGPMIDRYVADSIEARTPLSER